jgi:hypothetical protein
MAEGDGYHGGSTAPDKTVYPPEITFCSQGEDECIVKGSEPGFTGIAFRRPAGSGQDKTMKILPGISQEEKEREREAASLRTVRQTNDRRSDDHARCTMHSCGSSGLRSRHTSSGLTRVWDRGGLQLHRGSVAVSIRHFPLSGWHRGGVLRPPPAAENSCHTAREYLKSVLMMTAHSSFFRMINQREPAGFPLLPLRYERCFG